MKVLIIGGTALVGPYLLQEIFSGFPDAKLTTITRSGTPYLTENALCADRNDLPLMEQILRDIAPDILIDMIPFTACYARNTAGLVKQLCPQMPVIAVSSIDVYSAYARLHGTEKVDAQPCPIGEDMALRQKPGPEGEAYDKLNVEKIYLGNLSNITILRLPAIYGWPDSRRIGYYLEPMLNGEDEIRIPRQAAGWKFSRCLHKNAAFAAFTILQTGQPGQPGQHIYNVAEETSFTEFEWCEKIAHYAGWRGRITLTDDHTGKLDMSQDFYVSSQKIRAETGFTEKYSADAGLAEAVKLYAHHRRNVPYRQCY